MMSRGFSPDPPALVSLITGWRARIVLVYAIAAPPLAASVAAAFDYAINQPFPTMGFIAYWSMSGVFTFIGAIILACITRWDRGVTLVNAVWTQLPVWALFVVAAKRENHLIAGAMAASIAIVALVTLTIKGKLRGSPPKQKDKPSGSNLKAFFEGMFKTPGVGPAFIGAIALGPPGLLGALLLRGVSGLRSWRLNMALLQTFVAPPIALILFTIAAAPQLTPFATFGFMFSYLICGLQALSAGAILALMAREDRRTSLVHAVWAPTPASILIIVGGGAERFSTTFGLAAASIAASAIAALIVRRLIRPLAKA